MIRKIGQRGKEMRERAGTNNYLILREDRLHKKPCVKH